MKILARILIVLICLSAISCDENRELPIKRRAKGEILPSVSGKAGEVVVVVEENTWKSQVGQVVWDVLGESYPFIPQVEPQFDIVQIPNSAFTSIFKTHRNLVFFEIDKKLEKPKMEIYKDRWAHPQTIVTVKGKSYEDITRLIKVRGDKLVDIFEIAERKRIEKNYKEYIKRNVYDYLKKNHGIKLYVPVGYKIDIDEKEFLWISHETSQISQGIFIYRYPYENVDQFELDNLVAKRDEILKKYVPGPTEGSFMTTEKEYFPEVEKLEINGRFVAKTRGLWKVENNFMGGPFISFATVDQNTNEIVVVEGFVFAPQFKKRNYLRQLEAILYTLDFTKDEAESDQKRRSGKS